MTPQTQLVARAMGANYAWMVGGFCLLLWALALPQYKDQLLPSLYAALGCGIVFIYLLHRLSEGRGLWRALGLVLLVFVGHIAVWLSFIFAMLVVEGFIDHTLAPVPVWPLLITIPITLICCARLKRAAQDDDPWLPVTRSWFGRRVTSPDLLDCPCEDGAILAEARTVIARQNAELAHMRKALDAERNNRAGQLEEIEAILTLPGVREKLRSLAHPDKHPEATPAEQRRLNEMFKKLTAIYDRLGRG